MEDKRRYLWYLCQRIGMANTRYFFFAFPLSNFDGVGGGGGGRETGTGGSRFHWRCFCYACQRVERTSAWELFFGPFDRSIFSERGAGVGVFIRSLPRAVAFLVGTPGKRAVDFLLSATALMISRPASREGEWLGLLFCACAVQFSLSREREGEFSSAFCSRWRHVWNAC